MKKTKPPPRNLYPFCECINWENMTENDRVIFRAIWPEVAHPEVTIEVIPETLDEVAEVMRNSTDVARHG